VAVGRGDELSAVRPFDATGRHARDLLVHLRELLAGQKLAPTDLDEVYVSVGPGGFTGLRVGVTVVRTLAQAVPGLRCVAVPSALALAENFRGHDWRNLGVLLDAREGRVHASLLKRRADEIMFAREPAVVTLDEFLKAAPRPLLLTGQALEYLDVPDAEDISLADETLRLPTAEGAWCVGRRLAAKGRFTEYHRLLPVYARSPKALRLWQSRNAQRRRS